MRNSVWVSLVGENFATLLNLDIYIYIYISLLTTSPPPQKCVTGSQQPGWTGPRGPRGGEYLQTPSPPLSRHQGTALPSSKFFLHWAYKNIFLKNKVPQKKKNKYMANVYYRIIFKRTLPAKFLCQFCRDFVGPNLKIVAFV